MAWTLDTAGIQAASVTGIELVARTLFASDAEDPSTAAAASNAQAATTVFRLGYVRDHFSNLVEPDMQSHLDEVARKLVDAGADVSIVTLPLPFERVVDAHRVIAMTECAAYHQARFSAEPQAFGPEVRAFIEQGALIPAVSYLKAQRLRRQYWRAFKASVFGFDALLMTGIPRSAPADLTNTGDKELQIPWSLLGCPVVALPSGLDRAGLPVGFQLVADPGDDGRLLRVARWCEAVLGLRLSPPLAEAST